jgi:ClpP class serine protease
MPNLYACDQIFLREYLGLIAMAERKDIESALSMFDGNMGNDSILSQTGDVATINISGVLGTSKSKIGIYLGYSYTTYQEILDAVEKVSSGSVNNVAFAFDSPGGEVHPQMDEAWQAINELSKKKNTVAINKNMLASAAYFLASATGKIESVSDLTSQGSIGVCANYYDFSKMDEALGIRKINLVSKNAPLKNLPIGDPKLAEQIQARLNDMEDKLIGRISEGLSKNTEHIAEKFGKGALVLTKDAVAVGMLSSVRSYNDIISSLSATRNKARAVVKPVKESRAQMAMTLKEMLAEHPELNASIEAIRLEAFESGAKSAREIVSNAVKYIGNTAYTPYIQQLAQKAISGDIDAKALEGAVAYEDQMNAAKKIEQARTETSVLPIVAAIQPIVAPVRSYATDGKILNKEDQAMALKQRHIES